MEKGIMEYYMKKMGRIICCNKIDQYNNNNTTYNSRIKNKWIISKSP
jgi:NADPH-dependent curcumin reductase CurA